MARSGHNKAKRIGILGGTFNPVHFGHINLAESAKKRLNLHKVYFVPGYLVPHKRIEGFIKPSDRVSMARLAIKNLKGMALCLYEINRKRKTYSISTIKYFRRRVKAGTKLFFLIGSDSIPEIYAWKRIREALGLAKFACFARPGYSFKGCPKEVLKFDIRKMDISSSGIRRKIREGASVRGLLPRNVIRYIKERRLYGAH